MTVYGLTARHATMTSLTGSSRNFVPSMTWSSTLRTGIKGSGLTPDPFRRPVGQKLVHGIRLPKVTVRKVVDGHVRSRAVAK